MQSVSAQLRALFVGAILGTLFSIIIHKLSLTTGIIPSLNIAAGLIGFVAIKGWVSLLKFFRFDPHDFTPQVLSSSPPFIKLQCQKLANAFLKSPAMCAVKTMGYALPNVLCWRTLEGN